MIYIHNGYKNAKHYIHNGYKNTENSIHNDDIHNGYKNPKIYINNGNKNAKNAFHNGHKNTTKNVRLDVRTFVGKRPHINKKGVSERYSSSII